jgi:hypothetical protein
VTILLGHPGTTQVERCSFWQTTPAEQPSKGNAAAEVKIYQVPKGALVRVAQHLEEWASYDESGISHQKPFEVRFRVEASTDLMEQAQDLLKEGNVHLAAPVVLAGASLEEFLRSMVVDAGLTPSGKPGINTYATELQKAEMVSRGETKDIISWADQRNNAAHGEFDNLDKTRTQLMIDGINFFISKHT